MRAAVIGHVEWTRLVGVARVPLAGEISHASVLWEGPAGGGAVAAVQLAKLVGHCTFYTALGDDELGERACSGLERHGVTVQAVRRDARTREAVSLVDAAGERTTLTLGERLQPSGADPLPWDELVACDVAYFTAGDRAALWAARRAPLLVATTRELAAVQAAGVDVDVLVGSARDPAERCDEVAATLVVMTDSVRGGSFRTRSGDRGAYDAVAAPGPVADSYGIGDSFVAAVAFALASELAVPAALALAARCGAACLACHGPFDGQLHGDELARNVRAASVGGTPWR
ncbi:MAG TPA: PfkB family carbohydrate kinase [Solirubrobacteraceae bacterium]|jgi:ribokinase|nr:PfkB family carbohydrate kinase [Solirubrobacteraceae bacterium]